ncbi:NEQ229 [Nanoarchaeum equitans Kin4-M]|uniref:NEQ229 n=1 Tax=Nanoarchaeum equitans (strain Kin4-M) TaxID=228908 RepID=Q74NE5_NANEQ|nr:NEQ229 [Nanoarchaeum equitans Kin4-M]
MGRIDSIDIKILSILEENARTKFTDIAKTLNLTEAAIRKRIKKLEENQIIKRYSIDIDYKKLGYNMAIIGLDIDMDYFPKIIKELEKRKEFLHIYSSAGDHDIMVIAIYKDLEEIYNYLKNLKGVKRVCPAIIIDQIK